MFRLTSISLPDELNWTETPYDITKPNNAITEPMNLLPTTPSVRESPKSRRVVGAGYVQHYFVLPILPS